MTVKISGGGPYGNGTLSPSKPKTAPKPRRVSGGGPYGNGTLSPAKPKVAPKPRTPKPGEVTGGGPNGDGMTGSLTSRQRQLTAALSASGLSGADRSRLAAEGIGASKILQIVSARRRAPLTSKQVDHLVTQKSTLASQKVSTTRTGLLPASDGTQRSAAEVAIRQRAAVAELMAGGINGYEAAVLRSQGLSNSQIAGVRRNMKDDGGLVVGELMAIVSSKQARRST